MHLDGYNLLPALTGQPGDWPRRDYYYWNDDGDLVAMRYERYKAVFLEQRAEALAVWRDPFVRLRAPLLFELRTDPFERAQHNSIYYNVWC